MKNDTDEAQPGIQGKGGAGGHQGRSDDCRTGERVRVHPNQNYNWKRQLLAGAPSVFEGSSATAQCVASEAQVDLLYRQISQLKVENDFLARKLGK